MFDDDGVDLANKPRPVAKTARPAGRKPQPDAKKARPNALPTTNALAGLPSISEDDDDAFGRSAGGSAGVLADRLGESVVSASAPGVVGQRAGVLRPGRRGAAAGSPVHIDPQWRDSAVKMESAVLQWVRLNDVAWARTVKNVLGERLRKHAPDVFTDCEGIGAPLEALRILEFIGALGPYHHLASCEIDQDARAWLLKHHRCPDVVFGDMLARTWPGGVDVDLLTNTPREIPHGADIYICGFPCCPFSLRKSNSKLFEEEKA